MNQEHELSNHACQSAPRSRLSRFRSPFARDGCTVRTVAWEIAWTEGTRELVETGARKVFPALASTQDIGRLAVEKVEEEIRLHPEPAPGLPQFSGEEVFRFGRMEVLYHIDSAARRAEIRKVTVF